jgi:hypothetical protein
MHTLHELYEFTLSNPEKGAKMLYLADKYLLMYDDLGEELKLPKEHDFIKPILEKFAKNPKGFSEWLFKLRNDLPKCAGRVLINALYRKVMTRALQRERRTREDAAIRMALKIGLINDDYATKQAYIRKIVLEWGKRRTEILDSERKFGKGPRIPLDEQEIILADFWKSIEAEIEKGELPKP